MKWASTDRSAHVFPGFLLICCISVSGCVVGSGNPPPHQTQFTDNACTANHLPEPPAITNIPTSHTFCWNTMGNTAVTQWSFTLKYSNGVPVPNCGTGFVDTSVTSKTCSLRAKTTYKGYLDYYEGEGGPWPEPTYHFYKTP